MKVILVFVSTLDGKVTKWDDPDVRKWSSGEDKDHFSRIWKDSKLIVMGSKTYLESTPKASGRHLFHVMTSHPPDFSDQEVPGRIEFSAESPAELVSRFEKEGYNEMLVVGGPKVSASFLKERLADELWLTIEPRIFGSGLNLGGEEKLDISLELTSCLKVNTQGTLITKYSIIRK